jgi:hypothetical protein
MKIKAFFITMFAVLISTGALAAEEVNVFKVGTVFECTIHGCDALPAPEYPMTQEFTGTQIINNIEYLLLCETQNGVSATEYGLREDSGKVYAISLTHPEYGEKLIYDFSLNAGDTASVYDGLQISKENCDPFTVRCVSVENVVFNEYELEKITVAGSFESGLDWESSWLKGIGSLAGVMWNFPEIYEGGGVTVNRIICEGKTIYQSKASDVSTMSDDVSNARVIRYNINGTIADKNSSGIYIENGKKHIGK